MASRVDHARLGWILVLVSLLLPAGMVAFQVTGPPGGLDDSTGARPNRYEITQFAQSGAAFDLLILAMIAFEATNQSDPLSYFQIAGLFPFDVTCGGDALTVHPGIHGFPRIPWDGVTGNGSYPGFCTHAATPFPTWHRPYMALFEQLVWSHAQDIATSFPDDQRDEYQRAALGLRFPYWDWAVNPALPDVVTQAAISINTPQGWETVDNPLYSYVFQGDPVSSGIPATDPMAKFGATVRWWNANTQASNQSAANTALKANAATILSLTYDLLASVTNYTAFSCTWPGGQVGSANNIEAIHNSIHNSVGGFGHMQFPEVAGFDPIFWLHHANVDRLFAMWQALNRDSYILPTVNAYGSYYEAVGFVDSGTTALAPFHSDDGGTMFTSDAVRDIKAFGYSYPELPDWEMNATALADHVRGAVNALYNPKLNTTMTTVVRRGGGQSTRRSANLAEDFGHVTFDMARQLRVNNLDRQWSIVVVVARFPIDTSFCLDFFMGDVPDQVSSWATAPNLIGTYAQFGPANVTILHPDGSPAGQVHGEISLTHTLAAGVSRGALRDLSPRSVVPVLRRGLNWRARTATGEEVPLESLTGLSVSVGSKAVVPSNATTRFPIYGSLEWHESATGDKPCGRPQPRHRVRG